MKGQTRMTLISSPHDGSMVVSLKTYHNAFLNIREC